MKKTFWLPALLVLALLLAACGGDSDDSADDSSGSDDTATAEPSTDNGDGDDGDDGDDSAASDDSADDDDGSGDDDGDADDSAATDDGDAVELTATARGVTADTITLGVGITDVTVFAQVGDIASRYQPLVDATNAAGGINGRQVEIIVETWDVLDQTAFDESCIALTEDNEVFIVLGFLIDGFSNVPCYTDVHDTVVINTTILQTDDIEISGDNLLTTRPDEFASLIAGLEELAPELDGAKVAVYSGAGDDRPDVIAELVAGFGAEVAEITVQQISGSEDLLAAEAEMDTHVERWRAAGVEWLINTDGSVANSLSGLQRAGLTDMNIVSPTNIAAANAALGADLSVFPKLIATGAPDQDQLAADGLFGIPECIAIINEATGEGIEPFGGGDEGDDLVATTVEVCAAWDIFVTLATAAGPNLTPESFLQAGYDLGPFDMTGSPSGTVEPGQPYVSDASPALFVYDEGTDIFVER